MNPCDAVDQQYPSSKYGGFDNSNALRNVQLSSMFKDIPKARKTGTTICGVVFDGGVVLGADTRATGELVVDKNCQKLHYVAPNIYCAGAGTAADCRMTARNISSQLELLRLETGTKQSRVVTAVTITKRMLFQHQGALECALIIGGVDSQGSYLYPVAPHGSTDSVCFATQGSGSLAAMSVIESRYKDKLTEEEAMAICCDAILAGIFNDLGSGSNVDLVVIRQNDTSYLRGYRKPNEVDQLLRQVMIPPTAFKFPVGTTRFIKERVEVFESTATEQQPQAMEVEQ